MNEQKPVARQPSHSSVVAKGTTARSPWEYWEFARKYRKLEKRAWLEDGSGTLQVREDGMRSVDLVRRRRGADVCCTAHAAAVARSNRARWRFMTSALDAIK